MSERIPPGWARVPLGDVVEVHDARRVPVNAEERATRVGPYPYYGANGQAGTIDDFLFDGDFALVAEDGGYFDEPSRGVAYRVTGRFWVNNHAHILAPRFGMETRFLVPALNAIDWMPHVSGTTRLKLTQGAMVRVPFLVPPLDEQRRIVAKLEALQARSRRAREALDAVPPLFEKLRQSILAAAFRGDLTKDWRAKHPDVEPASELLKRIRAERRKKWEQAELAKLKAKGKPPSDDRWKAKYKEPEPVDASGLHELPKGWCWSALEELLVEGPTNGVSPKSDAAGSGTLTLKLSATTRGCCVLNDATTKRTIEPIGQDEPYWLGPGDILVQRANTIEYVGVSAIFEGPERTYVYPDLMMRLRANQLVGPHLIWRALSWEVPRKFMRDRATGTAGNMPKVNGETVRRVPIPLPPLDEQRGLLKALERCDELRGQLELALSGALERVAVLDRAILGKAFRGELVPQDPSDEPADVMLARLARAHETTRSERAKAGRSPGRARTGETAEEGPGG